MAMKQRLLNRCQNCGHAWFPRGFDLSRRCPDCGGEDVDFTGRFYLAILVVFAIGAGILWATDRPHKTAKSAATPMGTPLVYMKPRHAAQPTPGAPLVPPLITTEAQGRAEALRLYPDLGVANSALNREFVTRYRSYQRLQPDYFQDPAWPVLLVKECAAVLGEQARAR
jgi:hypothetical protein